MATLNLYGFKLLVIETEKECIYWR